MGIEIEEDEPEDNNEMRTTFSRFNMSKSPTIGGSSKLPNATEGETAKLV